MTTAERIIKPYGAVTIRYSIQIKFITFVAFFQCEPLVYSSIRRLTPNLKLKKPKEPALFLNYNISGCKGFTAKDFARISYFLMNKDVELSRVLSYF